MRQRLLAVAEVAGWIAVSFTVFLALRVLSILLNLVDLGQCTDSCDAGPQALQIALFTFGLAWCPVVLVCLVRAVKRGSESWWAPHALALVLAHAVAMLILVRIFSQFPDADTRTEILASCAAGFDVVTGFLVMVAPRGNVAI